MIEFPFINSTIKFGTIETVLKFSTTYIAFNALRVWKAFRHPDQCFTIKTATKRVELKKGDLGVFLEKIRWARRASRKVVLDNWFDDDDDRRRGASASPATAQPAMSVRRVVREIEIARFAAANLAVLAGNRGSSKSVSTSMVAPAASGFT